LFLGVDCGKIFNSKHGKCEPSQVKTGFNPQLERLPSRIQSGKPRCPICDAVATDSGTCPYCHTRIKKRWKPARVKDFFEIFALRNIKEDEEVILKGVTVDVLYSDKSFFEEFKMKNYNFGDEISNYKSYPRLLSQLEEKMAAVKNKKSMPLVHVEKVLKCEDCGCTISVQDLDRGEIVCPRCGLVQGQIQMHDGSVVL
jgi:rubrerythrin